MHLPGMIPRHHYLYTESYDYEKSCVGWNVGLYHSYDFNAVYFFWGERQEQIH